MTINPYSSRLAWVAGLALAVGFVLILVGSLLDTSTYDNILGIDFEVVQTKIALIVAGNAMVSLGVIATIGWTVLAGVRWQLQLQAQGQQWQEQPRATAGRATPPSAPQTLDEIRAQLRNDSEKSGADDGYLFDDR